MLTYPQSLHTAKDLLQKVASRQHPHIRVCLLNAYTIVSKVYEALCHLDEVMTHARRNEIFTFSRATLYQNLADEAGTLAERQITEEGRRAGRNTRDWLAGKANRLSTHEDYLGRIVVALAELNDVLITLLAEDDSVQISEKVAKFLDVFDELEDLFAWRT